MNRYVANGLNKVTVDFMAKSIAGLGFNCVRLTYSLEQVDRNPRVQDWAVAANPHLKGKSSMEVLDATVKALTDNGVMVILNNHVSNAIWCCSTSDGNGLWYNPDYSERKWVSILEQMTTRYKDNAMVIGNDLRNELRKDEKNKRIPLWGTHLPRNDWRMAA